MKKSVKYALDAAKPLSENNKSEIKALSELPDSKIDYSDIPPLTDEFWKNAVKKSVL